MERADAAITLGGRNEAKGVKFSTERRGWTRPA